MTLECPVCILPLELAGRTFRCNQCEGVWVGEDALVAILESRVSTLVELPWQEREDKPRPCAHCKQPMQTVNLGSVALDRCASHGVWFDANEMTTLLRQSKRFKTAAGHTPDPDDDGHEAHREGLLRRFAKLFTGG